MMLPGKFTQRALFSGILLCTFCSASEFCSKTGTPGEYSNTGRNLCFQHVDAQQRHLEIPSPDGSLILVVDGEDAKVESNEHGSVDSFTVSRDEEILWSPDSRALLFTISFGAAGPVTADFGYIRQSRASEGPSITERIRKDFASRHTTDKCYAEANVAGLSWVHDSKNAVSVAEVPPSPQCEHSGGYLEGYLISLAEGRIVERYSMKETILRWQKDFGKRLNDDVQLFKDERRLSKR